MRAQCAAVLAGGISAVEACTGLSLCLLRVCCLQVAAEFIKTIAKLRESGEIR